MNMKPAHWEYIATFMVLILCSCWAYYEYQNDTNKIPFEPIIAVVSYLFALGGIILWKKGKSSEEQEQAVIKPDVFIKDSKNVNTGTIKAGGDVQIGDNVAADKYTGKDGTSDQEADMGINNQEIPAKKESAKNDNSIKLPTLLMTFAPNDLLGVPTEAEKIWKTVKNNKAVKAKKISAASIDTLAKAIIDCGNDLFMFHYGGHSNTGGIVLEGFRDMDKIRLSRLLLPANEHHVQVMFMNGCLSYGHVGILTAKGVKAIIATNVNVNDEEAVRIADFFYQLFFEKNYTLKAAFESAEATVSGRNAYVILVNPGEIDEQQPMPGHWTLFIHAEHKEVIDWRLSDFLKSGAADSEGDNTVNPISIVNSKNVNTGTIQAGGDVHIGDEDGF